MQAYIVYSHNGSRCVETYRAFSKKKDARAFAASIPEIEKDSYPAWANLGQTAIFTKVFEVIWPQDKDGKPVKRAYVICVRDCEGDFEHYGTSAQLLVLRVPDIDARGFSEAGYRMHIAFDALPPGYNYGGPEKGLLELDGSADTGCL